MTTTRPRAFIVHQPMKIDPRTQRWRPAVDLSPAGEYGDLIFLLDTPERPPLDPEASLPALRDRIASYTMQDYIVLAGDLNLVVYACVLAARLTGGKLNLLKWHPKDRRYVALPSTIYGALQAA